MTGPALLSRPFDVNAVPREGTTVHIEATPSEREAIAKEFDLLALDSLSADLRLVPQLGDSLALDGRLRASVVQRCVISLVPVPQEVDEEIAIDLVPEGSAAASAAGVSEDRDPPETFGGVTVDLGAIAMEYFAMGLDPYPRAPGAELPAEAVPKAEEGPFAALAALSSATKRGKD
jgi:hypothetical protein